MVLDPDQDVDQNDGLPQYTGQDMSAFTVLMVHKVASRLHVLKGTGYSPTPGFSEDDMRTWIKQVKPEALPLIDATMTAYRDWAEAKVGGAADTILESLRERTEDARKNTF
jgi:hypothetical protein